MPNDLIDTDALVARNFYLEIGSEDKIVLSAVSGIEIELDVVAIAQNGYQNKQQHIKTLGGVLKAPDITMTRMAPFDATKDPIWIWFKDIRDAGMKGKARQAKRKSGSIVLYDSGFEEVGRYNWYNGWPSKITIDALSTDSNDPMKEQITLVVERIDRIK